MRPAIIKERAALFIYFKDIYHKLLPLISRLDLSDGSVRYHAQYVLDTRSSSIARRGSDKYLLLLSFVIHQYLSLGDSLILTLLQATSSSINHCEERAKEMMFQQRHQSTALVNQVTTRNKIHLNGIGKIEKIAFDDTMDDRHKIIQIQKIIQEKKLSHADLIIDEQQVEALQVAQQKLKTDQEFYKHFEKESVFLQNRASLALQHLVFDEQSSHRDIYQAVQYFQEQKGDIYKSHLLPTEFLSLEDKNVIYSEGGQLKVSLYKALLFKEVALQIKAGALNILSSYEYRSYEKYLIDKRKWETEKENLLDHACLSEFSSAAGSLKIINQQTNEQFRITNEDIDTNEAVFFDKEGKWHLHRDKAMDNPVNDNSNLYPQKKVISILEVLTQINKITGFLGALQYKGIDNHTPKRPTDQLLFAAILGFGENIGIRKMGLISKNINPGSLENVATHYFSPEMIIHANDLILTKSNQLPIIDIFRTDPLYVHTGSDGQKFDVSVASLRASASFKYFGNGKGVTLYSHLDEAGQLIYSTVFSAADKEAPYILDALAHDEIISSDAHSTDTHGYSEAIAAITGLWGIESRPRLANIHKLQLYSIDPVASFKERQYKICPNQRVDYNLIIEHWDSILRLVTTIKLGHEKASVILRRLNSYSRQNPVFKALKELGRLFKTQYILRFISEEQLRRSVESMLSKVENANKFAKAIMLGNNQEFNWQTQYDQLIAEGCKRLIINAINYYNLLLLSQHLCNCKTAEQKEEMIKIIASSSTHTWRHINLHGEFDFTEQNSMPGFDMEAILNLDIS